MSVDRPYHGDVRLQFPERDAGKSWMEIEDFDVFNGIAWVSAREWADQAFAVEPRGPIPRRG